MGLCGGGIKMRKDIVKLDRETYESLVTSREARDAFKNFYINEREENNKLRSELGYYKALFDKESDTEVIKCNGKMYRIVRRTHCMSKYEGDSLDVETELINEE